MDDNSIVIYIASHKQIKLPNFPGYYGIQVNAEKNGPWEGWLHDNDGDNISVKNECYSELTALYSLWKNSQAQIKGLVHYRRYFVQSADISFASVYNQVDTFEGLQKRFLTQEQINRDLQSCDLILPSPKCVYPLTVYEDLKTNCYKKDLIVFIEVVKTKYPEAFPFLMDTLNSWCASYCNMMIAGREVFDNYCAWVFPILAEIEKKTDVSSYDRQRKRLYGYFSEILLNVYVKMRHLKCAYHNIVMIEDLSKCHQIVHTVKTVLSSAGFISSARARICKTSCRILTNDIGLEEERKMAFSGLKFCIKPALTKFGFIHIQDIALNRPSIKCVKAELPYLNDGKKIKIYYYYTDEEREVSKGSENAIKIADSLHNIICEIDQIDQISIYRLYLPFLDQSVSGKIYNDILIL